jgi:hypothetical protein
MPRFEKIMVPPERQRLAPQEVWPRVQAEDRRQLERFYPPLDKGSEGRVLHTLQQGIFSMWSRGAARIEDDGRFLFWNPEEGAYQCYDQEYNRLMLEFLRDFTKQRR